MPSIKPIDFKIGNEVAGKMNKNYKAMIIN